MINHIIYEKTCYDCNRDIETTVYSTEGVCICEECYYQRIVKKREDYKKNMEQELSKEYPKMPKKYWE